MSASPPQHLGPVLRAALADVTTAIRGLYGDRLRALVLFGSQARGDARTESDVDVLVVLEGDVDFMEEVRRMLDVKIDVLDRHELLFSLLPVTVTTYENRTHPLMMNVNDEGLALV